MSRDSSVILLSPLRLEELRPQQALWVDSLRARLAEAGALLRLLHWPSGGRQGAVGSLERLVARERAGCWVLVRASLECQAWFERSGLPCVVAGTCHEGVALPSVDLDYHAMCRHAAVTLARSGHRRIVFLSHDTGSAGDLRSEAGFVEGVRASPAVVSGRVVRHGADRAGIARTLRHLMRGKDAPTALFINYSFHYLTVFSVLAGLDYRVPENVSLVCRDEDVFLSYVEPEPTRYVADPLLFARKLARMIEAVRHGHPFPRREVRIIPRLLRGASLKIFGAA